MITINAKIKSRLQESLKKYQPVLENAKVKDVNESDTVIIITDILSDILGYDKYTDITSEYAIKKTFCDLAIKIDNKLRLLIECKAIGLDLKDDFVKQAIDYGSNAGVDWVVLTNGHHWKVYKIAFTKPIDKELIYEFNICDLSNKKDSDLELLYYISKEALSKSALEDLHSQKQALSRFYIGQLILTNSVIDSIRKSLRAISPDIKVNNEEIRTVLINEVLKREVIDGEKSNEAKKKIEKTIKSQTSKNSEKIRNNTTSEKVIIEDIELEDLQTI